MKSSTDSTVEEDIGEIKREQIFIAWDEGKTLKQIAEEVDLPIKVVSRNLKRMQRPIIEKGS